MIPPANLCWLAATLVAISALGCGANDGKSDVSGLVTVDGTPVSGGSISFTPVGGRGPSAGGVISEGRYQTRVVPGPVKVAISVQKVVGERKLYRAPNSPVQQVIEESLPPRYNEATELQIDVREDSSEHNFDLSTS
jgi:hypothetical protein